MVSEHLICRYLQEVCQIKMPKRAISKRTAFGRQSCQELRMICIFVLPRSRMSSPLPKALVVHSMCPTQMTQPIIQTNV